jgi:hypothetical protein
LASLLGWVNISQVKLLWAADAAVPVWYLHTGVE